MSGRHLQHGDVSQPDRNMEVFTNCSTSITTFGLVTLLLNGSGVGRCYDDDLMLTNWDNAPNVLCVLDPTHKDYDYLAHESVREARHKYGDNCIWHDVEDSREGWGKAVELVELLAYERIHADKLLILNFSGVRAKGSPIGGMQDRPSSGPVPLMNAFMRVNSLKGAGMDPWLQAMYIDHYFAECVLVGGVRRSARMAVKHWKDKTIFKFMQVKRPIEFIGKTGIEVESLRLTTQHRGFLWSANNSVALDKEFWELLNLKRGCKAWKSDIAKHARKVFDTLTECAYYDGTGEPGTVNADRLHTNDDGIDDITGSYFNSDKYTIFDGTHLYLDRLLRVAKGKSYRYIVNPCGEIVLAIWGAFCVSGNTRIAHRQGYDRISTLIGREVDVWNGQTWSKVMPFQTGQNRQLMKITFSDGSFLECTPQHNFSIKSTRQSKRWRQKQASWLKPGDILPTFRLDTKIYGGDLPDAYTYGVFIGDGSIEQRSPKCKRYEIDLYGEKRHLPTTGTRGSWNGKKVTVCVSHLRKDKLTDLKQPGLPDWVFQLSRKSTIELIKGWIDTDGCQNEDAGITLTNIDLAKCQGLQLLLRRVGISYATVGVRHEKGQMTNFGPRPNTLYGVYIPKCEANIVEGHRVKAPHPIDLEKVVKQQRVTKVEYLPGLHDTFCFTEPQMGMGVFNNVLTYQCTICDVCFYHCDSEQECEEAIRAAVRAMMRVNLQDNVYSKEVKRTNRIGIGLTGVHEFALKFFGFTFRDLIDEQKSIKFWEFLSFMRLCAHDEAVKYATKLGVAVPHTICTVKPSGTISKLFGLTEGWHLPSMRWYLRWVQFDKNNPLVEGYRKSGYPIKELSTYKNTVVVGFPTVPLIAKLDPNCVTAAEATPEEQYKWLMLGEKYWLGENGNQISYTLKYDPEKVSYLNFKEMFLKYQSKIRACSVMPQEKGNSGYEYLPEEPIGQAEYNAIAEQITQMAEDIGREHLDCGTGGCPVDFKTTVIG